MNTELATRGQSQILTLLRSEKVREELAKVAPSTQSVEGLVAKAYTLVSENPYLQKCTDQSILRAVKKSVICGLELDGRNCHIVPYKDQAQFIIDVKGYMKLGMESGLRSIKAYIIHANDNFREWSNENGIGHTFTPNHRGDRGPVIGALSVVKNASGEVDHEFMSLDEINRIKARSRSGSGPWTTDENEMRKKTVLRRHSKRWPLGSRLAGVWDSDDDKAEMATPIKARILPDEVVPAAALPAPERANLLPDADAIDADLVTDGEPDKL